MEKLIRSNGRGRVTYNMLTEEYKFDFGNIYMTLDFYQFKEFEELVEKLDFQGSTLDNDHRVRIPFESDNLSIILKQDELIALKDLMGFKQKFTHIKLNISFSIN